MVDLTDAGKRLASYRAGPIPPVAELQERVVQDARRRRRRRTTGAVMIGVALVGGAVGVLSAVSRPHSQAVSVGGWPGPSPTYAATGPAGPSLAPAGSTPVDWNQLRLWLPRGWTVTPGPDTAGTRRCWTPPADSVYLTTDPVARCDPMSFQSSIEVIPLTGAVSMDTMRKKINGVAVWVPRPTSPPAGSPWVIEVPSLGVKITAYGANNPVVDTLGPSALHSVLAQRYPTAIPAGTKRLTFDGFQADVPAFWPTHTVKVVHRGDATTESNGPGLCGLRIFAKPSSYLGQYTGPINCPDISFQELLHFSVVPTDGLWIRDVTSASKAAAQPKLNEEVLTHLRSGTAQLTVYYQKDEGANTVDVDVTIDGRTLQTTIGLGLFPSVAEGVISSLRLAGTADRSAVTTTTITG